MTITFTNYSQVIFFLPFCNISPNLFGFLVSNLRLSFQSFCYKHRRDLSLSLSILSLILYCPVRSWVIYWFLLLSACVQGNKSLRQLCCESIPTLLRHLYPCQTQQNTGRDNPRLCIMDTISGSLVVHRSKSLGMKGKHETKFACNVLRIRGQ